MRLPALLIALLFLAVSASALTLPTVPFPAAPSNTGLVPVASFEGGYRFQAGEYPVIVLSGSYREMGRQYGALMKKELNEEYAFILENRTQAGYTQAGLRAIGKEIPALYPQRMREIFAGMSETSGLTYEDVAILYYGAIFQLTDPAAWGLSTPDGTIIISRYGNEGNATTPPAAKPPVPVSCSYLAAWGNYTSDGSVIASRNWDLDDAMMPFVKWYVLAVYRPTDGSNSIATWGPAGMRPETYMNSRGLFIANDNAGIPDNAQESRPEFITEFYRFMFDYPDLQALDAGIRGTATDVAWIVDTAGPDGAYVYEKSTGRTLQRSGNGVVAAANHFTDPSWNLSAPPEHSASRYNGLLRLADAAKGSIDAQKMMQIRDVCMEDGGARFCHSLLGGSRYSTNHQVVFIPKTLTLWVNAMDRSWQKVELAPLFGR